LKTNFPQSNKKLLVKFGASWCAPCRQIHPEIEKFAARKASEYEVLNIDLDDYRGLAEALDFGGSVPVVFDLLRGTETSLNDSEDKIGPIKNLGPILEYLKSK
jgi:thioredoxin-like negative regulator of GroEL